MPRITYSRHARERMILRGISRREVEEAIRRGRKRIQDGRIVATYLYFEVVYVVDGHEVRIISVIPRW
ncbi:MAG: DUF4258 domain-containing protein [Candidatus Thermoplasmatota archaeon]|nr:DUF4258 domain-containing protein [Candidatus Thermoplasmatota archaeon]